MCVASPIFGTAEDDNVFCNADKGSRPSTGIPPSLRSLCDKSSGELSLSYDAQYIQVHTDLISSILIDALFAT